MPEALKTQDDDSGPARVAWRRRKSARPQEIIDAATKLLEEEGTANLSMAQIARGAGVSEATLYKYYDSKQALLSEVFTHWARPFVASLMADLPSIADLHSQLSLIALRFLRGIESTPRLHLIFYREIRWADYRGSSLHKINHDFAQTIVDAVRAAQERGEVRADLDPRMVRDAIFGGLEHIAMRTIFAGRDYDAVAEASRYIDFVLHGIAVPEANLALGGGDAARLAAQLDRLEALLDRSAEG